MGSCELLNNRVRPLSNKARMLRLLLRLILLLLLINVAFVHHNAAVTKVDFDIQEPPEKKYDILRQNIKEEYMEDKLVHLNKRKQKPKKKLMKRKIKFKKQTNKLEYLKNMFLKKKRKKITAKQTC